MRTAAIVLASTMLGMGLFNGPFGSQPAQSAGAAGTCSGYYKVALSTGQTMTESDVAATDCANVTGVAYDIHLPATAATGFESELGVWQVTVDIDYFYDMPPGRFYTVTTIQTSNGYDPATYALHTVTSSGAMAHTVNSYTNIAVRNKI